MANTTLYDLLPWLGLSLIIFLGITFAYFDRLEPIDKIKLLIHFVLFIFLTILLTIKFLENHPWDQIIWMFAFFALNAFSWMAHMATPKQAKKNE